MPDAPASPESEQIADVAINEEETIAKRPALESDDAEAGPATGPDERRPSSGDRRAERMVGPAGLEPAT